MRCRLYWPCFGLDTAGAVSQLKALVAVIQEAYVHGISTRSVDDLVKAMGAGGMSKSQVSRLCAEIDERVNAFLTRPLEARLALSVARRDLPEGARGWQDRQPCRDNRRGGERRWQARGAGRGHRPIRSRDVLDRLPAVSGQSGILCARPVSSLADEALAEDDGELWLGLEPLARRSFPFLGGVVEHQI